jgi:class 3 adenylate cyclase/NAD(P)-dependent dehydrogenase (short-subunit alcohol dehydrogenase family)
MGARRHREPTTRWISGSCPGATAACRAVADRSLPTRLAVATYSRSFNAERTEEIGQAMYAVNWDLIDRLGLDRTALASQTALVTGGARGIGEGVAMTMAAIGAQVVIVDKRPTGRAVADAIEAAGGRAHFIECDLAVVDELEAMIPRAIAAFGQIDILVNNALRAPIAPLVDLDVAEWDATFATNARAPFLLIKHLLPGMLERRRGVVVNMIAYEGSPGAVAYAGTKMALRSMAFSVAREIGNESGVAVFSFVPGIVDTPLINEDMLPPMMAALGITTEQAVAIIAQNPGYEGLVPVDHCATALVHAIVHGAEHHGQVADPFEPLDRIGVIQMPRLDPEEAPALLDVSGPQSGLYIKQYLGDVTSRNKELEERVALRTRELEAARKRSESLLLNILPAPIAERLKQGESMIADHFEGVTVLFADIVDFTPLSAGLTPGRAVDVLDAVFSEFDRIAGHYELEKIKTIGDCYMAVGGLPEPQPDHAERVASAALEMIPALSRVSKWLDLPLSVRIGLHTGDAVAGVIGRQKFVYDLWGDTVNTASRMETHGVGDRIQCTERLYRLLDGRFRFEPRGEVDIKGKGSMPTYFLVGAR